MPLKHIFKHLLPGAAALIAACVACTAWPASDSSGHGGYYRYPSVHGDTVVFASEEDLWTVGIRGGTARAHPQAGEPPARV